MRYDLPGMVRRSGNRRKSITLRPIIPTKALSDRLARLYLRIVAAWQEAALGPILDECTRTLAEMTTDSPADINQDIERAESGLQRLLLTLFPELEDWVVAVEEWHRGKFTGAVLSATGINIDTLLTLADVREDVASVLARNTALMKDLSAEAQGRISDIVFRGVNQRQPARVVAKELREAVGMSRKRALRIAADQANKLTATLDDARREDAGIEEYKWRHSGKLHPRAEHKARDGKIFKNGDPQGDTPGQAPYCGCRAQPYINLDD